MNPPFKKLTVLGAGTMGQGIAHVCAAAGMKTVLYDVDISIVEQGLEGIRANLDKGVALGKVTEDDRETTQSLIMGSSDLSVAIKGVPLVIEAAPESIELKRKLFHMVEQRVGADTILATNTSSLSIAQISEGMEFPARFLGIHFFNPVHIMDLVEIVWCDSTAKSTREMALEFARFIGKDPIVVKDSPGFASSRLGVVLGLEAIRMVEAKVAEPEAIDKAMTLGYRHPMGPLRLTDLIGLDIRLGVAEYLQEKLNSQAFQPPELLKRMVAEGKLGKKSGQGFYRWEDE